jgi:hypothetical protein
MLPAKPRYRRAEATQYLTEHHGIRRAPSTLAKLACIGGGPEFQSVNRVPYYTPKALDEWATSLLTGPRRSTSDPGTAAPSPVAPRLRAPGLGGPRNVIPSDDDAILDE